MEAVELGAELELAERAREVHVREDEVRLRRLVGAAEQHGVRSLADELDPLEVVHERVHRQREDALAAERLDGGARGGLDLRRRSTSMPCAWSSSASCVRERVVVFVTNRRRWPFARKRLHGVRRSGDRLSGNVQNTVDVEQNRSHDLCRVYSRHEERRRSRSRRSSCGTSRSSGPGGQHAQKSETRVEAVFDVEASSALSDAQKRRVVAKAGPVLRAIAQDERSQLRNRELAIERLVEALREALRVQRRRVPTKPSAAAKARRVDEKKRRGEVEAATRGQTTRLRNAACASFARRASRSGTR